MTQESSIFKSLRDANWFLQMTVWALFCFLSLLCFVTADWHPLSQYKKRRPTFHFFTCHSCIGRYCWGAY